MDRADLTELHYITPIETVPSVFALGILSHRAAERYPHKSVAMPEMLRRREKKVVPRGLPLPNYANLYFHARNPMMCKIQAQHKELCVLRIDQAVLDIPGAIVTDENAGGDWVAFRAAPNGLEIVNEVLTFAEDWRDANTKVYYQKKAAKCAEVLVPNVVPSQFIFGAYVSCTEAAENLQAVRPSLDIAVDGHLFFR